MAYFPTMLPRQETNHNASTVLSNYYMDVPLAQLVQISMGFTVLTLSLVFSMVSMNFAHNLLHVKRSITQRLVL